MKKSTFKVKLSSIKEKCIHNSNALASLLIILFAGMLTIWFLLTIKSSSADLRLQEFIWSDVASISQQVNDQRRLSASSPLLGFASNKLSITLNSIWLQTLNALSPTHYFGRANAAVDTFAVHQHGFFYPIDAVLIIIGLSVLWFAKNRQSSVTFLLSSLLLISFLPSMLKTDSTWITFRGGFTIIYGLLIVAIGFEYLLKHLHRSLQILLVSTYIFLVISFFYHYFFRYPAYSTHNLMYSTRVLSSYLQRSTSKVEILNDEPESLFQTVLLFGNHITKQSINQISQAFQVSQAFQDKNYRFENIRIYSGCISNQFFSDQDSVKILKAGISECQDKTASPSSQIIYPPQPIHLVTPFDSGTVHTIYGDDVCQIDQLSTFVEPFPPWQAIENLSDAEFCQSFFVKDQPQ